VDDGRRTRLVTLDDVPALAALHRENRAFLAPYEPVREESYYTEDGQRTLVRTALERHAEGTLQPHVVLDEDGRVVGRATLNEIVRGPLQSCSLGYWLAATATGRGLATAAVRDMQRVAFEQLGLHRIQAGTLVDNVRSQRVLERTGFTRFGLAPSYLHIAGQWRDHVLYQVVRPDPG
jgi:[ribosomal protein S5]-alanine N-acetyltransferase